MILILLLLLHQPMNLLEMTFAGADREHAQGAIERHDLAHREIQPRVFLISVADGTPEEWAQRLTSSLPAGAGSFKGRVATREQVDKVARGEITLQR